MPGPGFASSNLATSGARDIAFSADQSRVYIALANGTVSVVNLATRAVEATWNVGTSLGAIALSDDGANLLVLERSPPSDTAVVYRVSTATGTVTTFSRGGTNFLDLSTMANNRVVLTGAGSNYLTMDIATGTFGSMAGGVFSTTTSVTAESGDLIVFSEAGSNGRLSLLNGATQQFVATGSSSQSGNGLIAVSSNAQLIAQFRNSESVDIFDANLQLVRSINVGGQIDAIAFSASGRQLFVHNLNGEIMRVDPATGAVLDVYATGAGAFTAGTALTGSEMIVSANGNHVVLRNHNTGALNLYDFSVRTDDETIAAVAGANAMAAGAGDDTYFVDNAGDTVSELALGGYDLINASVNFSLAAGSYVDVLASANPGGTQGLTLNGNELANRIIGDAGANALDGREGNDQLEGLGGNDILRGGAGNDYLIGGAGDDWFNGGADTDVYDGGAGSDTVSFSSSALGLIVNLDVAGGVVTLDNREVLISIENIDGSDYADSLTGSSGNNRLDGGFGNDVIDGRGGLDLLFGNEGDDTIILRSPLLAGSVIDGGGWNDTLQVQLSAANGTLSGYGDAVSLLDVTVSGIETLAFQGFSFEFVNVAMTFAQASAIGSYVGGGSVDRVFIVAPAGGGDFTLPTLTLSNFAPPMLHSNHDSVALTAQGQNADYTLRAGNNSSVQELIGGPGNDVLHAGGGSYNWLTGGAGDDTFFGGSGDDQFNGETGRDTVSFATQDAGVFIEMVSPGFGFGGDAFYSIEVVVGSNFDDTILGLSTADEMWGGYGADSFQGRDGNDSLYGGWGNDRLEGGGGNDSLFGNEGDDTLVGGAGADLFDGGAGFDTASFVSSAVGIILDSNSSFGGAGEAQGDTFVSIELFAGSNFDDVISGTAASDSFVGNQGNDFLRG